MKKMKNILAIMLTFFNINFIYAQQELNVMVIDYRPLTWDDYQGKPEKKSPYHAVTRASVGYHYEYDIIDDKLDIHFEVQPYFIPTLSWVKYQNPELLAHEQIHYDIIKIFACDLRRELRNTAFELETFTTEIEAIVEQMSEYYTQLQLQYDEETEHGKNKEQQRIWEVYVYEELERLSDYQQ